MTNSRIEIKVTVKVWTGPDVAGANDPHPDRRANLRAEAEMTRVYATEKPKQIERHARDMLADLNGVLPEQLSENLVKP